jgi:hypothetical protein
MMQLHSFIGRHPERSRFLQAKRGIARAPFLPLQPMINHAIEP